MAEELNNEFDTQVRVQKAFVDATAKKVENHQALNDDEIKHLCPVAFTCLASTHSHPIDLKSSTTLVVGTNE